MEPDPYVIYDGHWILLSEAKRLIALAVGEEVARQMERERRQRAIWAEGRARASEWQANQQSNWDQEQKAWAKAEAARAKAAREKREAAAAQRPERERARKAKALRIAKALGLVVARDQPQKAGEPIDWSAYLSDHDYIQWRFECLARPSRRWLMI